MYSHMYRVFGSQINDKPYVQVVLFNSIIIFLIGSLLCGVASVSFSLIDLTRVLNSRERITSYYAFTGPLRG